MIELTLKGPVGDLKGVKVPGNLPNDVIAIRETLRRLDIAPALDWSSRAAVPWSLASVPLSLWSSVAPAYLAAALDPSRLADASLFAAIKRFQKLDMHVPDGRIDPGGDTLRRLNALARGKAIVVDLGRQVLGAYLLRNRVFRFHCATGNAKHPTPEGYYHIGRMHREYRSQQYDAQMDYAMFFHEGYAIHMAHEVTATSFRKFAGNDSVGSHGCVRLAESDAESLFEWTTKNTPVIVLPPA